MDRLTLAGSSVRPVVDATAGKSRIMEAGGIGLWIRPRFVTLPPVRAAEEAVMQRVRVVLLVGARGALVHSSSRARGIPSVTDQPSSPALPVA
jgi:hypothetical protein